jgi:hypothetical protein
MMSNLQDEKATATSTPSGSATPSSSIIAQPSSPEPSPPPSDDPAVRLSVTPGDHRTVVVTAKAYRPARSGYAYWFLLEIHKVSDTHSEFYPRQKLTEGGTSFEIKIPDGADISRPRTGRVFEVADEISGRMESGHPDDGDPSADFLLRLPCVCGVSNEIALNFKD